MKSSSSNFWGGGGGEGGGGESQGHTPEAVERVGCIEQCYTLLMCSVCSIYLYCVLQAQ